MSGVSRPVVRVNRPIAHRSLDAVSPEHRDPQCAATFLSEGCQKKIAVGIASCRGDWLSAFRLVYEAYTRTGLAMANPRGMRVTPYQLLPTTEILVATEEDRVVCTMSLVRDGLLGLPLEDVYADEVALRRKQGLVLAEVSCLATGDGAKRQESGIKG